MTSRQKSLGVAGLVLVPILWALLYYESDIQYELWIDEAGYAVQTSLVSSNSGLEGAALYRILVNPVDSNQLVAAGHGAAYLSRDGGMSWREFQIGQDRIRYDRPVFWGPDGLLYVSWGMVLSVSDDGGETWKRYSDDSYFEFGRLPDGSLWARTLPDDYFKITLKDGGIRKGESLSEAPQPATTSLQRRGTIVLEGHETEANVTKLPNGDEWAATASGSYFRASDQSDWLRRSAGQSAPDALLVRQSPVDPQHLLMLDTAGRLWQSSNFGDAWSLLESRVRSARFNSDGGLILVSLDGKVTEDGNLVQPSRQSRIDALGYLFSEEKLDSYLEEQTFLDAGRARSGKFWILTSKFGEQARQNYHNPFQTVAREWYLMESNSVLVEENGEWASEAGRSLVEIEPGPEVSGLGAMSDDFDLAYQGTEILNHYFFVGLPKRAGWLISQDRYYVVGESGIQIGRVSEGSPATPAVAWSWGYVTNDEVDRGLLRAEESQVWVRDETVELIMPGVNGLWRAEVPVRPGWHWRWFVYTFTFSLWARAVWVGFLVAFVYGWRRS